MLLTTSKTQLSACCNSYYKVFRTSAIVMSNCLFGIVKTG